MEALLQSAIEQISDPILLTLIVVSVAFIYNTKDAWSKVVSKISFTKKKRYKYDIKSLGRHHVFTEIERQKQYRASFISHNIIDVTKGKVFHDFLQIKMNSTAQHLRYILEQVTEETTRADVRYIVDSRFSDCNRNVGRQLKIKFKEKGLSEEVADTVINKFFDIRQDTIERFGRKFDSVFACDYYESNFSILLAIFENSAWEVEDAKNHLVAAFESVNGMFLELDYED